MPAVIVDVDGTLADVAGIRHYVQPGGGHRGRNFTAFHAASSWVDPHRDVVRVVQGLDARGLAIVVLTSRTERWRWSTSSWLAKWEVPVAALGMRADADTRPDHEVKRDLHARVLDLGYRPVLAIDDNPGVIALWRSLGIPTVRVPGWEDDD
ncbi:phosphatase domain-containing protein [Herbiconiux liangxiaofengii]